MTGLPGGLLCGSSVGLIVIEALGISSNWGVACLLAMDLHCPVFMPELCYRGLNNYLYYFGGSFLIVIV